MGTAWPGFFISFEGVDGAGKSTQVQALAETLMAEQRNRRPRPPSRVFGNLLVLSPGDTKLGRFLDDLLLAQRGEYELDPWTEALLFVAQRVQLWRDYIQRALAEGGMVIVDRWADSTLAYQGAGRGLDTDLLQRLHAAAVDDAWPDLTILLDVDPDTAAQRRSAHGQPLDRIASSPESFHAAVRDGFRRIAAEHPERVLMIDSSQPPERIQELIAAEVHRRIAG